MSLFKAISNVLDFDGVAYRAYQVTDEVGSQLVNFGGAQMPTKARPYHTIPARPFHTQKLSKLPITWLPAAAAKGRLLLAEAQERLALSSALTSDIDMTGFGMDLRGYQKAAVEYGVRAKCVLYGDEMRLGKTAEGLGLLWKLDQMGEDLFPALIICLVSGKDWWAEEGKRCLPDRHFVVLDSKFKPLELAAADVAIVNYDLLAAGWESADKKQVKLSALGQALFERGFKSIFLDEIHACKNHGAQRTKAVRKLAEGKLVRVGMTGTPVTNNPSELVPILQILGRLNDMGGWSYFMKRYCRSAKNRFSPFSGSHNEKELNERMRSSFYVRHRRDEVGMQMPPLTRTVIPLEIDNRAEYEHAEKQLISWVKQQALKDEEFKASIRDLDYDCGKPDGLSCVECQCCRLADHANNKAARAKRAEAIVKIGALKRISARGKLKAVKEWITDFDDKLVVFAAGKEILADLSSHYPHAVTITSELSSSDRYANVKKFQDGHSDLLIGAMGTSAGSSPAGVGLNMAVADACAILDMPWTSAHWDQLESRIVLPGKDRPCTVYGLVGRRTIEEKIIRLIDGKRMITSAISDGKVDTSQPPLVDLLLEELAAS